VRIGDGSWLGHGTVVLPGVTIGRHVVIGANSVVTDDIPDRCVAAGSPARVIRRWVEGRGWVREDGAR
jgi:acetyltransferase-like isoleucine patch superfamily enzyme